MKYVQEFCPEANDGSSGPAGDRGATLWEPVEPKSSSHGSVGDDASRIILTARFAAGSMSTVEAMAEGPGYSTRTRITRACLVVIQMTLERSEH